MYKDVLMSLENHLCIVKDNKYILTVSQDKNIEFEASCFKLLTFLKKVLENKEMENFKEKINFVKTVKKDDLIAVDKIITMNKDEEFKSFELLNPYLEIEDVFKIVQNVSIFEYAYHSKYFAKKSWHCKWLYLLDLDKDRLEIYKGCNKTALQPEERFYFLQDLNQEYKPVKYVFDIRFKDLISEESIESVLALIRDSIEIRNFKQ